MGRPKAKYLPQLDEKITPIASLTASRNMETVKAVLRQKYGLVVTDRFAQDLIDFVEALTDGQ